MYFVYQAMTLSNAEEDCSLERLEVMGDSVIKYFVTTHIFLEFPDHSDGELTGLRNLYVSNEHFRKFGDAKCLGEILAGSIFKPSAFWLPPTISIPENV